MSSTSDLEAIMADVLRILINNYSRGGRVAFGTPIGVDTLRDNYFLTTDDALVEDAVEALVEEYSVEYLSSSEEAIYLPDVEAAIEDHRELEERAW